MSFINCNIYVVLVVLLSHAIAIDIQTLRKWHNEVTNMKYNCPAPKEIENSLEKTPLLLEVVDCNQPLAIYRYDFKVRYLLIYIALCPWHKYFCACIKLQLELW